jgi:hypothetical protein
MEVKAAQRREDIALKKLKNTGNRKDIDLTKILETNRLNLESAGLSLTAAINRACECTSREEENPVAKIAISAGMRKEIGSSASPSPLESAVLRMLPPEMFSPYLGVRFVYIKIEC